MQIDTPARGQAPRLPGAALDELAIPRQEDYFGVWAIEERWFQAAVARVHDLDLHLHVEEHRAQGEPRAARRGADYAVRDGVAVIELTGPLMKFASSFEAGTSTVYARRQIRAAVRDPDVSAILLVIDSPGGTVSGTADLADEVAKAAKSKRVEAFIEDLGASAAYWVASQAGKVWANRTAAVGSIGVYSVLYDQSAAAAQLGVKVHVIRAGEFKGMGEPGTEITADQLGEAQRLVNEYNDFFVRGVASGRRLSLSATRELADGRVHIGQAAVELKLVDGLSTVEATLATLTRNRSKATMSEDKQTPPASELAPVQELKRYTPEPASFEDLKLCCPGADNDFLVGQLERKATIDQAQTAWMETQNQRIKAVEQAAEEAEAKAARPGVEPVGDGAGKPAESSGDAVAEFDTAVREQMGRGKTRRQAIISAAKANRELHAAYVAATNKQTPKVQALIAERFAAAE
jgi:signal peptide peptidase SppA